MNKAVYLQILILGILTSNAFAQVEEDNPYTTLNPKRHVEVDQVIPQIDTMFKRISFDDVDGLKNSLKDETLTPNTLSKYGDTPLVYAIKEKSRNVINYLLQVNDLNVNFENRSKENALMLAAFVGDVDLVKKLVNDKHATVQKDGWSAIHYAATNGNLDIVKFLIDKKADVDAESPNGTTPLMMACKYGHIQVVKYLLDHDADLSVANQQKLTAIDFANQNNQREIAAGLMSRWKKLYGGEYVLQSKVPN